MKLKTRDRTSYKLWLKMIIEQQTVNRDELTKINSIYEKVYGKPPVNPMTSCGSCIKKRAMDVYNMILTPEEKEQARLKRLENRKKINAMKAKNRKS